MDITVIHSVLTPLQAFGILIWYFINEITDKEEGEWYKFSTTSLITVLTEVAICIYVHSYS